MATFRAVILTGTGQVRADGYANVKIKVQQGKNVAYIKTDLFVLPREFVNGQSTGPTAGWVNKRIIDYLQQYSDAYLKLGERSYNMTAKEIRNAVTAPQQKTRVDFMRFMNDYMKDLIEKGKTGSHRRARGVVSALKKYTSHLYFDEIDSAFLHNFEAYLRREGVTGGVGTYMASLRVIFNRGREKYNDPDRGVVVIANYPFIRYKVRMSKDTAKENALTSDQVMSLMSFRCRTHREQLARDVFKIMLLTMGPNTSDVFKMPKPVKGRIKYDRSKTGHKFAVKVEDELLPLIEKYKGGDGMFSFGYRNADNFQRAVNEGLKSICKGMGIRKITTNWARHTFATICRTELGISRDDVGRCLGHSSRSVTDIYIRYNYEIEDRVNRRFIDHVFVSRIEKVKVNAPVYLN